MAAKVQRALDKVLEVCNRKGAHPRALLEAVQVLRDAEGRIRSKNVQQLFRPTRSNAERLSLLMQWARKGGCEVDQRLELVDMGEAQGNGFRCRAGVQAGEVLFRVPSALLLTHAKALQVEAIGKLVETYELLRKLPDVPMALYLIAERCKSSSRWSPYLDVLPESFSTPLYWTAEEIECLEGEDLQQCYSFVRDVARQYAALRQMVAQGHRDALGLSHGLMYDDYRWAMSVLTTRRNQVNDEQVLIPVWDMCNHERSGPVLTGFDTEKLEVVCPAMRDFEAKQQVFINYGTQRPRAHYLIYNGFVPQGDVGPDDFCALRLSVPADDAHFASKEQLLKRLSLVPTIKVALQMRDEVSRPALLFARVAVHAGDAGELDPEQPASGESEMAALRFLLEAIEADVAARPTTQEEDEALLAGGALSSVAAMAVRMRRDSKIILRHNATLVRRTIKKKKEAAKKREKRKAKKKAAAQSAAAPKE